MILLARPIPLPDPSDRGRPMWDEPRHLTTGICSRRGLSHRGHRENSTALRPFPPFNRTVVVAESRHTRASHPTRLGEAYPKTGGSGYGRAEAGNHGWEPASGNGRWRGLPSLYTVSVHASSRLFLPTIGRRSRQEPAPYHSVPGQERCACRRRGRQQRIGTPQRDRRNTPSYRLRQPCSIGLKISHKPSWCRLRFYIFLDFMAITAYLSRFGFVTFDIVNARFLVAGVFPLLSMVVALSISWFLYSNMVPGDKFFGARNWRSRYRFYLWYSLLVVGGSNAVASLFTEVTSYAGTSLTKRAPLLMEHSENRVRPYCATYQMERCALQYMGYGLLLLWVF